MSFASNGMAHHYRDFQELLRSLNDRGARYVIVGGYAIAHHGWPRYTKDLDLLIEMTPDNAQRVVQALAAFGFSGPEISAEKLTNPRTLLRLGRPPTQVEILTSIDGVSWDEVYANREPGEYAGVPVAYIGREQFIQNKRAAGRLRDLADIEDIGEDPGQPRPRNNPPTDE